MTKKSGLCFAVAAVLSLAMATDSQAFWGSRGGWGSGGSSGGSYGGSSGGGSWGGGSGGGWGSNGGSHGGGIFGRLFNRGGSNGSCGSSGGYNGCGGSCGGSNGGSSGGSAYYGDGGGYYTNSQPRVTYGSVAKAATPVKTQLTLHVPADATVTLAGVATKPSDKVVREFATSRLTAGQAWENYQVVVEMNRDGKMVREERTITLVGGQAQELSIGVSDSKLARLTP